ncbi:alkane 1-monooxygenase [Tropicimonas sp. IMCC34011]|uniref:alkane 1-monooxygenase n=1 Tax=Tropicimonas sp. IMCC34011 TaxID=2248759 RepID=UPI000E222764|nr:alkane 1-monooxygenase [Tropicimonas sp. IMCC34011]
MSDNSVSASELASLRNAAPFWLSMIAVPLAILSLTQGGLFVLTLPLFAWGMFGVLDVLTGLYEENADTETPDADLKWYRLVTLVWFPVQFALVFGSVWYATRAPHLNVLEEIVIFFGLGVISGTIGIVYAHELMHQTNRLERWLGDLLMGLALYGHFRSEHLLVHHRYVGTPRDPVTARYNEGFHQFFPRVLRQSIVSSFKAEAALLARRDLPWWHRRNPFWRYGAIQLAYLALALIIGGWGGLALFLYQAFVAIWQLEVVNYVEHYGLTRKHLGGGKYEHVKPRHSWNAAHKASNWLLINLQRHSDHHFRPDRRFPLLQTYSEDEAPQLPHGYPVMAAIAMFPHLWRRRMNPKVREWRRKYYPEIEDWTPYKHGTNPMPR